MEKALEAEGKAIPPQEEILVDDDIAVQEDADPGIAPRSTPRLISSSANGSGGINNANSTNGSHGDVARQQQQQQPDSQQQSHHQHRQEQEGLPQRPQSMSYNDEALRYVSVLWGKMIRADVPLDYRRLRHGTQRC